jgi:hypothetical protein
MDTRRMLGAGLTVIAGATLLGGCVYRTERTVPAASPATTVVVTPPAQGQRVYTYPEGRWELRGQGTTVEPYIWVWIPTGANPPALPPLPR